MKACIFDLDGTLTDTLNSIAYSVNMVLREMELKEISDEQCTAFVGNGARYLLEHALAVSGEAASARIEEAMERYGRIFQENCTYLVKPYEGIPELLKAMQERGMKLSVLSNKPDRQTKKVVREVLGEENFDFVMGQTEGIRRKPEPDGVYELMKKMGVSKEECLYIGDSEVDITTADRAGVTSVIVTWGFRTKQQLLEAGAKNLADQVDDIFKYIEV